MVQYSPPYWSYKLQILNSKYVKRCISCYNSWVFHSCQGYFETLKNNLICILRDHAWNSHSDWKAITKIDRPHGSLFCDPGLYSWWEERAAPRCTITMIYTLLPMCLTTSRPVAVARQPVETQEITSQNFKMIENRCNGLIFFKKWNILTEHVSGLTTNAQKVHT